MDSEQTQAIAEPEKAQEQSPFTSEITQAYIPHKNRKPYWNGLLRQAATKAI
jgi:hypothetical protein